MPDTKAPTSSHKEDRSLRDQLKVEKTQCLQHDLDTGKKYLVNNKGDAPVAVNSQGQIPSKFNMNVTGVINYKQRQTMSK